MATPAPKKTLRVNPVIYRDPGFRRTTSCTDPGFVARHGPANNHTVADFEALDTTYPHHMWKVADPSFLVEPQNVVGVRQPMRPFIVTMDGVDHFRADPGSRLVYEDPFHAAIEIWYDGRAKQLDQPTRVVRQMPHWTRASRAGDSTERVHFLFDEVWVDTPGKFTFRVNIYLPRCGLDRPPYVRTPFSPSVTVTRNKARMERGPREPSKFSFFPLLPLLHLSAPPVLPYGCLPSSFSNPLFL